MDMGGQSVESQEKTTIRGPKGKGPTTRGLRQLTTARGFPASILWGSLLLHLRPNYHLGSVTEAKL